VRAGNLDLVARNGIVNFNDAGGEGFDLNIVGRVVVGADNVNVGGKSTGLPAVQTAGLNSGAGVASVPADTAKTADAITKNVATNSNANQSFRPNIITVEVFCLGPACGQ
jgi:hypothetical protein